REDDHRRPREARRGRDALAILLAGGAQSLVPLAQLGRHALAELVELEDGPDLDLGAAVERGLLEPLHGFVDRLHLPDPVAGDQLLGLGERSIDDGALLAGEADALAALRRLQTLGGKEHTGLG